MPQLHLTGSSTSFAPRNKHQKDTREKMCGTEEVGAPVAWRKATAQGKKAQQHASNATDLLLNELLGKYVITLSNTRQGHF